MTTPFYSSFNPILGNNGTPLVAGLMNFYEPGTTDYKPVYADAGSITELTNPVVLDGYGRATVFLSGDYDWLLQDSLLNQLAYVENINPDSSAADSSGNLVDNGSFELNTLADGKTPDSWTLTEYAGSTNDLSATSAIGAFAMHGASTGSGGCNVITTDYFEASGGETYTLAFYLQSTVADVRNLVQIHWYTSAKAFISSSNVYDLSAGNPLVYTRQLSTATAPATARFGKVQMYACHPSDATVGETWYDGVELINSSLGGGFIAGTSIVFVQSAAPTGWTFPAETSDRVLMFGTAAGGTQAGSWTITGYAAAGTTLTKAQSGMPDHYHFEFAAVTSSDASSSPNTSASNQVAEAANNVSGEMDYAMKNTGTAATLGRTSEEGQNASSSHTHTLTHTAGWRPAHRVVKKGTKS